MSGFLDRLARRALAVQDTGRFAPEPGPSTTALEVNLSERAQPVPATARGPLGAPAAANTPAAQGPTSAPAALPALAAPGPAAAAGPEPGSLSPFERPMRSAAAASAPEQPASNAAHSPLQPGEREAWTTSANRPHPEPLRDPMTGEAAVEPRAFAIEARPAADQAPQTPEAREIPEAPQTPGTPDPSRIHEPARRPERAWPERALQAATEPMSPAPLARPQQPAVSDSAQRVEDPAPRVTISIGRIEVRPPARPAAPAQRPAPRPGTGLTLDEYLRERREGRR